MTVIPFPIQRSRNRSRKPRITPRKTKKRLGHLAARKALNELHDQRDMVSASLHYLRRLAQADPDPRAIIALLDSFDVELIGKPEDAEAVVKWFAKFVRAYRKDFA